jgi:hypothetical protein
MTITSYRAVEPLYIVTLRNNNQAEQLFKNWIREHKIEHALVQGHRMMLHDQRSFEQLRVTWAQNISMLTIWDTWQRRHVYLD